MDNEEIKSFVNDIADSVRVEFSQLNNNVILLKDKTRIALSTDGKDWRQIRLSLLNAVALFDKLEAIMRLGNE